MVFHQRIRNNLSDWIIFGVALFLFLFPFLKRIKFGEYFEVEREIKEIRDDVGEFKSEIRQTFMLLSTTMSNLTSTVNVNFLPGLRELEIAQEKVREVSKDETSSQAQVIKQELLLDDEDTIMPLARTRIRIEQLLRRILDKRQSTTKIGQRDIRYSSARALFRDFISEYPQYESLEEGFNYVSQVCNAGIHGQRIPAGDASSALDLGSQIIAVLNEIAITQNSDTN